MKPSKSEVVHDIAVACVNALLQDRVTKANREDPEFGIVSASDLAMDAILAYKEAYDMIEPQIQITDD